MKIFGGREGKIFLGETGEKIGGGGGEGKILGRESVGEILGDKLGWKGLRGERGERISTGKGGKRS